MQYLTLFPVRKLGLFNHPFFINTTLSFVKFATLKSQCVLKNHKQKIL